MVNKKVVIICTIIALIIIGLMVGYQIKKFNESNKAIENEVQTGNIKQNNIENTTSENITDKKNETESNTTEKGVTQNQIQGEEETKTGEEENAGTQQGDENNKDKALRLVKEEWGEDDDVYYTVDNQSNETFDISVRSKSTTETLAEYEVDTTSETVVIK